MISLSVPNLKGRELEYVKKAIETSWVSTSGSYVKQFEEDMKKYLNVKDAVALQSGTAALHLALKLCNVLEGDEVIVPTLTFIAAVNPVKYLGAEPVFMDCDDGLNMDKDKLESFLRDECEISKEGVRNKKSKRIIKAIVVVHVFGNMASIEEIKEIGDRYNLKIVEDATESLGTFYKEGKYKGCFSGTIGDFGAFSFNGNKIITTGGGGMLVGRDENLLKKARYLSTQSKDDELYYVHNEIGFNYRMTNLQAALGVAQLECLEEFIKVKQENYENYKRLINNIEGLSLVEFNKKARNNMWFYSLFIDGYKYERDELLSYLKGNGVETRPIWKLNHTQIPYKNNESYKIERATIYLEKVLNIPCSTTLTKEDIHYIISKLA
ncbi:MAG: LegC family aminotransferase [Clostridium sp.]